MTGLLFASVAAAALLSAGGARAAEALMAPGDAVVTGFSGIRPSGVPLVPGGNPLDHFFINVDGASAQIQSLGLFGEAPQGQLVSPGVKKQIPAREIGQVFPITLDDGAGTKVPNAFFGASSQFGLHIVKPDGDGDGQPDRTKTGAPGATWMAGMFASDKGGSPGAIWRVDGTTGAVTLFATIPGNAGPGIGDIVFDKASRQFFASDLDTGLVHRLDGNGQLIDTFDHGVAGRPAKGLAAVADDGIKADITSAAFDIEKPATWGVTQKERRVHGMAVHQGRLFYTADRQVWSIGIKADGSFSGDVRWELDVQTSRPDSQLSDMLFDGEGRMYVAERGAQRGSYDFSLYAEAEKAEVKRYRLEVPEDPATPSRWVEATQTYAIGLPAEHRHSNGGIALGFPYDETGNIKTGSCGGFLWTTGERLRAGEFAQGDAEGDPAANADVHGLQGNPVDLVRPENVPPMTSYFTDYDSFFGDAEKAGHLGDVEIWQPCDGVPGVQTFGELPPWWIPPGDGVPPDFPPEFPDPEYPYATNLELKKRANPKSCWAWGANWLCRYQIRVRNTGPDNYFGPILVRDWFPANPAGLATAFQPQPPWACWHVGGNPANTRCWRPNVFLAPGNSVFLEVWAKVPKNPLRCRLTNFAEIEWAPGGSQWNSDPTDDVDGATAIIPDPRCTPDGRRSNLKLEKKAIKCVIAGNKVVCSYHITIENTGPDTYFGPLQVHDQLPAAVTSLSWAPPFWTCNNLGGGNFQCDHTAPVNVLLPKNAKEHLWISASVPIDKAKSLGCKLANRAKIINPLGAPKNTDPTDDADGATADMPAELCREERTNLRLKKTPSPELCSFNAGNFFCKYIILVINDGPGVYNGDLHVRDTFPVGTDLLLGPGPWTCDPPAGNTRLCKLNGIVMGPVTGRSFPVWLKVPPAVARDNECRIRNRAKIVKAPGGTPLNTNPADDEDDAVSNIPAHICSPPVPQSNLKITKRGPGLCPRTEQGYRCDWVIDLENTGPGDFTGNISLTETVPGEPVDAAWNAPWNCVGAGGGGGAICTHNNASIPAGGHLQLNLSTLYSLDQVRQMQCRLVNLVEIAQPAGNTPKNTNAGDDTAQAMASVDPQVCQTFPPPVPAQCPPGYEFDDGQCVPKSTQCPSGWTRTPVKGKCCPPGERWNGRTCSERPIEPPGLIDPIPPVIPPVTCPLGMNEVSSLRAHYLREQGWTVRRLPGLWCVKPPRETPCPPGFEEVPQSRISALRERGWVIRSVDRGKWCGKPGKECPLNTRYINGECVPVGPPLRTCPDGSKVIVGKPCPERPSCEARGMVGKWPNCRPVETCDAACQCRKSGGTWSHGKCQHGVTCWDGSKAPSLRRCPPRTHKCWNGQVLPHGKQCPPQRVPCGPGFTGYKPNCKPIAKPCPPGTVGPGQPKCRKIQVRVPCPPGTIGKYQPNCRRIQAPNKPRPQFKPNFRPGQKLNLR